MATEVSAVHLSSVTNKPNTRISNLAVAAVTAPFPTATAVGTLFLSAYTNFSLSTRVSNIFISAVTTPGLPPEPPEEPSDIGVLMLNVLSEVITTDKYLPLTASFNPEDKISGWIYDKRKLEDEQNLSTKHNYFLGGHNFGLLDGTALTDWQSGTVSGILFKNFIWFYENNKYILTANTTPGIYSLFWDNRTLYSDKSVSKAFSSNVIENGLQYLELDSDKKNESIQVALWKRNEKNYIVKVWNFNYVDIFTGEISGTSRLNTDNDGGFLVDNLAQRKKEFTIRNNTIYLNGNYFKSIGIDSELLDLNSVPVATIKDLWEYKGIGDGDGRYLYTKYFPLEKGEIRLAELINGTWTEYSETKSINFSNADDLVFEVDYDLGVIKTSGFKGADLYLSESIDEFAEEIKIHQDSNFYAYPDEGIITINGEDIVYYEKGYFSFKNLVRGHNSTSISSHNKGSKVEDNQRGKKMQGAIYIAYKAVPRIDYEISNHNERICNSASYLNLLPIANFFNKGILQIKSNQKNLAKIILSTDLPRIGNNLFGPMYYGTSTTRLTALALDSNNEPVDEIPMWIEIISGAGLLNGNGQRFDSISNAIGEIYAYYNSPYDKKEMKNEVTLVEHNGGNTIMTASQIDETVPLKDIWVFQILKDDPIFGTTGSVSIVYDTDPAVNPYGDTLVRVQGLFDEDYIGGLFICIGTDSVKYSREIKTIFHSIDSDDLPITEITFSGVSDHTVFLNQDCRLLKKESVTWVPALKNGAEHILYEWSNDVLHPIKNTLGAYTPLHPSSKTSNTVTFENRLLGLPDPIDNDVNLGGYFLITPTIVSLQAFGKDPLSGKIISSNVIRLSIYLNNTLIGVRNNDSLPIPIGWTLINEEHNIGSALGGANFITVNAKAENINQICLTGSF